MLVAMFAAVALGLLAKDYGRRAYRVSVGVAVLLTLIYFFRPQYMT